MTKRPDTHLIEFAVMDANGSTYAEIAKRFGITASGVSDRINRDRDLYDTIKRSYLKGLAYQRGINDARK